MKKIFRRKRTWLIILLLLVAVPVIYGFVMMNEMSWSEGELNDYFKNKFMQPQSRTYEVKGRSVFFASIGNDTLPMVLFIHGAPGSWTDYVKYFGDSNLVSKAHLVAPDRPGYGKSGLGNYVTSIEEQAQMLKPLLDLNKSKQPVILLGHSYGGPIAVRMAMNYPEQVKELVLLAPAIDPDHEKQFVVNKLVGLSVVQWMLPKMFITAYKEKMTHVDELKKMEADWGKITSPVVYVYGDKDMIVPPVNAQYAKQKVTAATFELIDFPNENHFIPWTQQDSVTKLILRMIER